LNNPLRFLLLVEDTSGRIRRGDVLLFYPADENLTKLPDSSFTNFFIFESMKTDGTFSLISLSDVTQYEMDFTNGSPGEFRLWQGRASIYAPPPDQPFCKDWFLITTVYYSDGSIQQFEDFLYTQCYDDPSSSGGGTTTPTQTPYTKTVHESAIVYHKYTYNAYWDVYLATALAGTVFPDNTSNNQFTDNVQEGSALIHSPGAGNAGPGQNFYTVYNAYQFINTISNDHNTAQARVNFTYAYPNQSPPVTTPASGYKVYYASVVLH